MQDMETLVCRQTLAGHKHDVLCLSGLHLSLLPKLESSAPNMGSSKAAEVLPCPHILVSVLLSTCTCKCPLQQPSALLLQLPR